MKSKGRRVITVTLKVSSLLRKTIDRNSIEITLSEGSNFLALAATLEGIYGLEVTSTLNAGKYGFSWICVRNKQQVLCTEVLEDGDNVMMLPPLAGG